MKRNSEEEKRGEERGEEERNIKEGRKKRIRRGEMTVCLKQSSQWQLVESRTFTLMQFHLIKLLVTVEYCVQFSAFYIFFRNVPWKILHHSVFFLND